MEGEEGRKVGVGENKNAESLIRQFQTGRGGKEEASHFHNTFNLIHLIRPL